ACLKMRNSGMDDKYTINLPIIKQSLGQGGLFSITRSSPRAHKEALEKLALYFMREEGYTNLQFVAGEVSNPEYHGFAFTELALDAFGEELAEMPTRLLGGGCFRKRSFADGEHWVLDWVWIHPYARNKGLFSNHIDYFKETFGNFYPEFPISKAMKHLFENKIRT
ncbi:hypothetical protein NB476_12845, partial [Vibrio sp. RM-44-3]|uniref:hypothetical protein n=1 Tax=Vibrio sp. RM-44-3 TaxID=2950156 RepID=UPI00215D1EDC